ncbi:MAG: type II toxin-antitoxin system VapC family toxin [Dehalococcoidia bacterium]|nr:type II toxin-antitoxin system VapC family toxin [Dehalococcoidia bacterium]
MDTNLIVALMDERDLHHRRALQVLTEIEDAGVEVLYVDCVINEVYTVMARRFAERSISDDFPRIADDITSSLANVRMITAYRYLPKIHLEVVELMKQTKGRLNYHDALIALTLREEGISGIITLHRDFDEIAWLERIG